MAVQRLRAVDDARPIRTLQGAAMTMAESLRAAAGGIAGDRRRMWQRRGYLHAVVSLAEGLSQAEDRPIRELARTLLSEANRALRLRRRSWLHVAVSGLAQDLARELAPAQVRGIVCGASTPALPLTARCIACGAVVAGHRRLCYPHWRQVPRTLQQRLIEAPDDPQLRPLIAEALRRASGRVTRRPFVGKRPPEFVMRPRRSHGCTRAP